MQIAAAHRNIYIYDLKSSFAASMMVAMMVLCLCIYAGGGCAAMMIVHCAGQTAVYCLAGLKRESKRYEKD